MVIAQCDLLLADSLTFPFVWPRLRHWIGSRSPYASCAREGQQRGHFDDHRSTRHISIPFKTDIRKEVIKCNSFQLLSLTRCLSLWQLMWIQDSYLTLKELHTYSPSIIVYLSCCCTTGLCGPYNAFVIKKVKACIGCMSGVSMLSLLRNFLQKFA